MRTVVVGGQARDVGKTSVIAGIITALPQWNWTAVKITRFGPEEAGAYGNSYALEEQQEPGESTDTARFLAAGARRALWLRVAEGRLREALPALRAAIAAAESLILESNRILGFLRPHLFLMVLNPLRAEFKPSARAFFACADAYLVVGGMGTGIPARLQARAPSGTEHGQECPSLLAGKPCFQVGPGCFVTDELLSFMKMRLQEAA